MALEESFASVPGRRRFRDPGCIDVIVVDVLGVIVSFASGEEIGGAASEDDDGSGGGGGGEFVEVEDHPAPIVTKMILYQKPKLVVYGKRRECDCWAQEITCMLHVLSSARVHPGPRILPLRIFVHMYLGTGPLPT